LEQLLKKIYI